MLPVAMGTGLFSLPEELRLSGISALLCSEAMLSELMVW